MRHLTREYIRRFFGSTTFEKGLRYFQNGHVRCVIRSDSILIGSVQGTADVPYIVNIDLGSLENTCSCPLRGNCKHVVATLLAFIEGNAISIDSLIDMLLKTPRIIIRDILGRLAMSNPEVIGSLYEALEEYMPSSENLGRIIRRIKKQITNIFIGSDLSYYGVPSLANKIERTYNRIMNLNKLDVDSKIELLIEILENIVGCFEEGVDDSSGILGDIAIEISSRLASLLNESPSAKSKFADAIVDLVVGEDYGLEFDKLIHSIVTKENYLDIIRKLKNRLLSGEPRAYDLERFLEISHHIVSDLGIKINLRDYIVDILPKIHIEGFMLGEILGLLVKHDMRDIAKDILEKAIKDCIDNSQIIRKNRRIITRFELGPGVAPQLDSGQRCFCDIIETLFNFLSKIEINREILREFVSKAVKLDYPYRESYTMLKHIVKSVGFSIDELKSILGDSLKFYYYTNKISKALEKLKISTPKNPLVKIIITRALSMSKLKEKALEILARQILKIPYYSHFLENRDILNYVLDNASIDDFKEILDVGFETIIHAKLLVYVFQKAKYKDIVLDKMREYIDKIQIDTLINIIRKAESIDTKIIGVVMDWIHSRTSHHKYYGQCIAVLKTLKDRIDPKTWKNIKNDLATRYRTKRKFIAMLKELG